MRVVGAMFSTITGMLVVGVMVEYRGDGGVGVMVR